MKPSCRGSGYGSVVQAIAGKERSRGEGQIHSFTEI